jgi:hypothetical protein
LKKKKEPITAPTIHAIYTVTAYKNVIGFKPFTIIDSIWRIGTIAGLTPPRWYEKL